MTIENARIQFRAAKTLWRMGYCMHGAAWAVFLSAMRTRDYHGPQA